MHEDGARRSIVWGGVIALPLVTLVVLLGGLLPDPTWEGSHFHFVVVSLTASLALVMALLMVRAATQLRDVRVLFLSLTYLGIAGIFLVRKNGEDVTKQFLLVAR